MVRFVSVIHKDNQQLAHDWRDEVNFADNDGQFGERILNLISELEFVWSESLERIGAAKHRNKLYDPNMPPVYSFTYCVGPETCKLKKNKSNKMLMDNIIEPARIKWASRIVFAPKKDDTIRFCVEISS